MEEQITYKYTIVPLDEIVKGWVHPDGVTHVLYVSGPGIYDKKALALCLSEEDAQKVYDAFTQRDLLLAELNVLADFLGE